MATSNTTMAKERKAKYPEEVLYYIEYIKGYLKKNKEVAADILNKHQISLSCFLDVAAAKSSVNFEATGNPVLQVQDIVQICYKLIIDNNIVKLIAKGWIEVVGLNSEGKPIHQLTKEGKQHLLKTDIL